MSVLLPKFLDTIALTQRYRNLSPEKFLSLEWYQSKKYHRGKLAVFILNVPRNSRLPRMTLSQSANHIWYLTVEVSFAAWYRGSNIQACDKSEIPFFLELLSDYVTEKSGLPFNAFKANVCRIDVVDDMFVGQENIFRIVKDIWRIKPNGFDPTNKNDETIYFENIGQIQNFVITFYDKYKQSCKKYPDAADLDLAKGILRLEVRLRTSKINRVVEKLHLPNRTAEVFLTEEVAEYILDLGKETVRFDLSLAKENDWLLEVATKFPIVKAILIIGFIFLLRRFGNDFYQIELFDFDKRSYQRYIKRCFDAGINPYE